MSHARTDHPSRAELLEHAERGELPPGVRTHCERCARCRAAFRAIETMVADARADRPHRPSRAAIERAISAFATRRPSQPAPESVGRPVRTTAPTAGVRGAAAAARTLFVEHGVEVELEVSTEHDGVLVSGQFIAGADQRPLLAWAETSGQTVAEVPIDGHGAFTLEALPKGDLDIVIELEDRLVRLPVAAPTAAPEGENRIDGFPDPEHI